MLLRGKDAEKFIRSTANPKLHKNPEAKEFISDCLRIIKEKQIQNKPIRKSLLDLNEKSQ